MSSEMERLRLAAVEAALDDRITKSLCTADWALDPPICGSYAHVNRDWLRAIIDEARTIRAALAAADPAPERAGGGLA